MIIGKIHPGSGLGDQLFSYIVTRVIALDKGYDFGFVGKEFFKGKDFMQLDWGKETDLEFNIDPQTGELRTWTPKSKDFKINKPYYDPEANFIKDGTIIDGYGAQDERYWGHRLGEIKEWLKTDNPSNIEDCCCIVNMRGGEYRGIQDLFLPKEYWDKGMELMKGKHLHIHTDDPDFFHQWYSDLPTIKNIEANWVALRKGKNAIISNSAFAIIPRLLKHYEDPEAVTIAPRYWNRYNLKRWDWPMNYYKQFTYIE